MPTYKVFMRDEKDYQRTGQVYGKGLLQVTTSDLAEAKRVRDEVEHDYDIATIFRVSDKAFLSEGRWHIRGRRRCKVCGSQNVIVFGSETACNVCGAC